MNWKLIAGLSLFGAVMAGATISLIPPGIEPLFWLVILAISGFVVGTQAGAHRFLHGLCVGVFNGIWMTAGHFAFATTYLANHPDEATMMASLNMPVSLRAMMLIVGPIIGVVTGAVIGVVAMVVGRFRPRAISPAAS